MRCDGIAQNRLVKAKFVDRSKRAEKSIDARKDRILRNLATFGLNRAQHHLARLGKVDTGRTLQSGKRVKLPNGYGFEFRGGAKFIQEGRGPTQNPGNGVVRRQISDWARRVGVDTSQAKGNTVEQKFQNTVKTITRKIHRKGIKSTDFTGPTLDDIRRQSGNIVKKFS